MRLWDEPPFSDEPPPCSMFNWTLRVKKGAPKRLADIMEMDAKSGWGWSPEELGSIFQHQMQLPVKSGLLELSPVLPGGLTKILQNEKELPKQFGEMFTGNKTDSKILRWTRTLALRCLEKRANPLPREVVQLIVCLAEAAAFMPLPCSKENQVKSRRLHERILKFPWLGATYRTLLLKYVSTIHLPNPASSNLKRRKLVSTF
jgi:hypothetical protein